jgi:serine/threonine-protein kinase HipA
LPDYGYNASLEQVGKILKNESDFPGDNLYRLYEMTVFNFLIGNVDAHLKNITLIYENQEGAKKILSPGYDIISTDLYIKDDNEESALAINGKKNQLTEQDFLVLAKSFGIGEKIHSRLIERFRKHLPVWDELIEKSFLEDRKKGEFKALIRRKLSRFS